MKSATTRLAALVLASGAAIFVLVSSRDPGFARLRLADAHGGRVLHRDVATFAVDAPPFSVVDLSVNGRRVGSARVPWDARAVRFEDTPLSPGRNVVVARSTLWYAASRKVHFATLRVDEAAHRSGEAPRTSPGARRPATHNARLLALRVREQEIGVAFAAQLPASSAQVGALASGRMTLSAFVDAVFESPRVNQMPIGRFFSGMRPHIYAAGDRVTVSADSGYQRMRLESLAPFAGELVLTNAFSEPRIGSAHSAAALPPQRLQWSSDVFRLRVEDYRVVERAPHAARREGASYLWERAFADPRSHVAVQLAVTPFSSPSAVRRMLNLPVFAFVPHVVARFLAFAHGFVLAVPMFAYLVLSGGRNRRFATVARRCIALAVAADVFDACISAQPDVDGEILLMVPPLRALPPALVNLLFVPALIGAVLATLAWCIERLGSRMRTILGVVVSDAACAVRLAAIGFVGLVALGYATGDLARLSTLYPLVLGAMLACGLLAALVKLDWWAMFPAGAARTAFTVATAAFAVAVAVPSSLVAFGAWAATPDAGGTAFADPLAPLPLAAAFLRSLSTIVPLAFGMLLLAAARRTPAELGLDGAALSRLLLCGYAVLAGVVVLIPVGFVLAWCTYPAVRAPDERSPAASRANDTTVLLIALAFVLVSLLVLLPAEVRYLGTVHMPFVALEICGFIAVVVQSFVLPAFALAWHDGPAPRSPQRALTVGIWAVACSAPAWLLQSDDVGTAIILALATAAFYASVGFTMNGRRPAGISTLRMRQCTAPSRENTAIAPSWPL